MNKSNINVPSAGTKADSITTAQNEHVSQPNANTNVVGSQSLSTSSSPEDLFAAIKSIENKTDWHLLSIAELGLENEYPACCIYAFCQDIAEDKHPAQTRALNCDGFIPCQRHYERFKNDIDNLKNLRVRHQQVVS